MSADDDEVSATERLLLKFESPLESTPASLGVSREVAAHAAARYPLLSSGQSDALSNIPTLNDTFNKAAQAKFCRLLDTIDDRILAKLEQPFGKPTLDRCFRSEAAFRHVLVHLFKSGFLFGNGWSRLVVASRDAFVLTSLFREFGDVNFNPLRGFPRGWKEETVVNEDRVRMTTAALLHFNGSAADMVRWIGGPHVAAHRDHPSILKRLRSASTPKPVLKNLERIFTSGIPNRCNASSTEANFQAYSDYGNHSTVEEEPEKTMQTVIKDNKRGYTLLFDRRAIRFVEHCHLTPQGVVDLDTPYKNPRPIFDSSFRPLPWCHAINDWTHKSYEPPLTFAGAEMGLMIWMYNLRITYPSEDIYLADDDISGAFRHTKITPDLVAMHTSVQAGYGVFSTGATFGGNVCPPNFDPIACGRRSLSRHLWLTDSTVEMRTRKYLPTLRLAPPCSDQSVFVPSDSDSLNVGVLDANGYRLPPPFDMHVDDAFYADVEQYLFRGVYSSAAGLFDILGWPDLAHVPSPLSMDKLETDYTHTRKMVGRLFDSRRMTVGMLPYKRDRLLELLLEWKSKRTYKLLELAALLGQLDNHTKFCRWARCWYFCLTNCMRRDLNDRYHVLNRFASRLDSKARHWERSLPKAVQGRLATLISRERASILWSKNETYTLSPAGRATIDVLYDYLLDTQSPWESPIGMVIPRRHHFESFGDASLTGGGAFCTKLGFWFDVIWSERTRHGCNVIKSGNPGYVHINALEFVVLILQLAAVHVRLQSLPEKYRALAFQGLSPNIPVWLGRTDNMVSSSWESKASAKGKQGQSLLGIYSELLRITRVATMCTHVAGIDNDCADDISRNDFSISLPSRCHKLFATHSLLKSMDYFLPSATLIQLLTSRLFSEPVPTRCVLPKTLGRFVPAGFTTLSSPSI